MSDQSTQPLWQIYEDSSLSDEDKLMHMLRLATRVMLMDTGIISQIEGNGYTVLFTTDNTLAKSNQCFNLGNTYPKITLRSERVIAIDQMRISNELRHPCHQQIAVGSYIGAPIYINGKLFGTLDFCKAKPHQGSFGESDMEFVDKISALFGEMLEQWTIGKSC